MGCKNSAKAKRGVYDLDQIQKIIKKWGNSGPLSLISWEVS